MFAPRCERELWRPVPLFAENNRRNVHGDQEAPGLPLVADQVGMGCRRRRRDALAPSLSEGSGVGGDGGEPTGMAERRPGAGRTAQEGWDGPQGAELRQGLRAEPRLRSVFHTSL